jgi:hypothetical protein
LFIWEEQPKRRVAWPEERADAAILRGAAMTGLKQVRAAAERHSARGIGVTSGALALFTSWYDKRVIATANQFIASFQAREDHHVLRVAGLLACNELSFVITQHHVTHAIKLVEAARDKASHIFAPPSVDSSRLVEGIERARSTITEGGELGVTRTKLLYATRRFMSVRELNYVLHVMHDLGMIRVFEESTRGRKASIYVRTDKLNSRAAMEGVIEQMRAN